MMIKNRSTGFIPYPRGTLRLLARLPLVLYQYGLGWVMGYTPFMVLTTQGRKSGLPRHVVLEYRKHGSKYYVVSIWGQQPQWYKNLLTNPTVTLQLGAKTISARAVPVDNSAEALRALYMFRRNSPMYEIILASISTANTIDLRTLTQVANEFTVVRFDVSPNPPTLAGVEVQSRWLGPLILGVLSVLLLLLVFRPKKRERVLDESTTP